MKALAGSFFVGWQRLCLAVRDEVRVADPCSQQCSQSEVEEALRAVMEVAT